MKQQADKELVSIRRILDILNGLAPSHRKRVMAFVNDRLDNPPIEVTQSRSETMNGVGVGLAAQLPFPNQEETKRAVADMDKAGTAAGGGAGLIGFDNPLAKQQALTGIAAPPQAIFDRNGGVHAINPRGGGEK